MTKPEPDPQAWQVIPHPDTGEAINLATADTETLLAVAGALRAREKGFAEWRRAAEDEVIRRMDEAGKKLDIVGDTEIRVRNNNEAVWDPDDLEATLNDLVDRGLLDRHLTAGIIVKTVTVSRSMAGKLMERYDPGSEVYRELARCRTWRRRSRRTIETAPVPNLADALPKLEPGDG